MVPRLGLVAAAVLVIALATLPAHTNAAGPMPLSFPPPPITSNTTRFSNLLAWTPDGSRILFDKGGVIYTVTTDGTRLETLVEPDRGSYAPLGFDVSPQGDRIAYATDFYVTEETTKGVLQDKVEKFHSYQLATTHVEDSTPERLTHEGHIDFFPVFSPDGERIIYISHKRDGYSEEQHLYTMVVADGIPIQSALGTQFRVDFFPPSWSPDGRRIAFVGERNGLFTATAFGFDLQFVSETRSGGAWSPAGERLAFTKSHNKGVGVYTATGDGADVRLVARLEDSLGHWPPAWSPAGDHLLVSCSTVCVVDADTGLVTGRGELPLHGGSIGAWSPDETRIAVMMLKQPPLPNGSIVLYTMDPDGSDVRVLVRGGRALVAEHSEWQDLAAGLASCSAGFVVPNPGQNAGLVRDCKTLMRARSALAGDNPWAPTARVWGLRDQAGLVLNWGAGTPMTEWIGVTVEDVRGPDILFGKGEYALNFPETTSWPLLGLMPPWFFGWLAEIIYPPLPRVTVIDFYPRSVRGDSSNNTLFVGTVPSELGDLTYLTSLNLSNTGRPRQRSAKGEIPPELSKLWWLQSLDLRGLSLSGAIPTEMGELENLQYLDLSGNGLSGNIPPGLGQLDGLRHLDLGGNELSGNIPSLLGDLPHLHTLTLTGNQLNGSIPPELGKLDSLLNLNMRGNRLSGTVPPALGDLENLEYLDLASNALTGIIPSSLGRFKYLKELWLSSNQLTGRVPWQLAAIPTLESLHLNDNQLECLPMELRYKEYDRLDAQRETCTATDYSFAVSELSDVGDAFGAVYVTEREGTAYSILSGNEDGRFSIDRESGVLTVANTLNADETSSYVLSVEGEDATGVVSAAAVHIMVESRLEPCQRGIAVPDPQENPGLVNDCALLLEAKQEARNETDSYYIDWIGWSPAVPMTQWKGIGLDGSPSRVATLDLSADGLNMDVMSYWALSSLGIAPPPQLGGLTALWGLNLRGFGMKGDFPAEWGGLHSLTALFVWGNSFGGCIPLTLENVERSDLRNLGLPYCGGE